MSSRSEKMRLLRDDFLELIKESECYLFMCRSDKLQSDRISNIKKFMKRLAEEKAVAIGSCDEGSANELLAYEYMLDAISNELQMYVALKSGSAGVAWSRLVDAQMASCHAVKSHSVAEYLEKIHIPRLIELERLLFPKQIFMSTGMIVDKSECSICGSDYGDCDHIKGHAYMGVLCARIVTKARVREVSFVEYPASKHCRVLSFVGDDGVRRDALSLDEVDEVDEVDEGE